MKDVKVTINGTAYPLRVTMGAMLLFKRETGREATEIQTSALSDLITFIWCCIKSASRHDKIDFNLSLDEFADGITPEEASAIFSVLEGDVDADEGDAKKKE